MDLSKLKKRPSYPFETVAVALGFTPRLEGVLSEAKRIAQSVNAAFILIHIGDKTREKEELLDKLIEKLGIDKMHYRLIWMEDGEPVDTILRLCKLNIVDLLIIGALEKENILKYYLGSVARNLSRKAKCSVLLLTHPDPQPHRYRKFVVTGVDNPKTIHTVKTSMYLAKSLSVKDITIVSEVHTPGLAMTIAENSSAPEASKIKKEIAEEESSKLHTLVDHCDKEGLRITEKTINGKPGFAIRNYAESKRADLLVINSPDTQLNILDRIFTHDIEYILEDLPCDVLIVHSRL
jgi:nucleotide-binding universal stress UspA family protein